MNDVIKNKEESLSKETQQSTIEYYNKNTQAFVGRSVDIDLREMYVKFLEGIPAGGRILDAGCGSGRDTRYFLQQGYEVVAFDASSELVKYATELSGQDVLQMKFEDMEFANEFDGVWACASLLHVEKSKLHDVLASLVKSLRKGGYLYMSLKKGEGEEFYDERHFAYFLEEELADILSKHDGLALEELWVTGDRQVERDEYDWLHAIAKRL